MRIGIAFDLRPDVDPSEGPDDLLEEYDSEATVGAIASALAANGHDPVLLGGGRQLIVGLLSAPPDLVFNIAEGHGSRSREAHVPAVCEMLGVPYTHSDPLTLAACLDKSVAKCVLAHAGIPTPRWWVLDRAKDPGVDYPVLLKPVSEGSSIGVRASSRVLSADAFDREAARLLTDYREQVIVEAFLSGAEFTVGVIGTGCDASVLGVMELVPRACSREEFVYSVDVKRIEAGVDYQTPPRRPEQFVDAVANVALAAYRALGCRDVGRVDIRCDGDGTPYVLELNPLPGLKPAWSDLVVLAAGAGWSYDALVGGVVDQACHRLDLS